MRANRIGLVAILLALWSPGVEAQQPLPIIDMHLHTVGDNPRTGLCIPWVEQFPAWDAQPQWGEVWLEAMTNPPCPDPIWSPGDGEAVLQATVDVLDRRNIIGVLSGPPDQVRRWHQAAPGRFIPSVQFKIGRDDISPDSLRRLVADEGFRVLGEISNQYAGIAPDDERMEPYWALAEELDFPVALHMGEGTVGTAFMEFADLSAYRARLTDPYLLEEVLIRHPRLRISVMHYASPLVDEMIAMLGAYPQLYIDIGGIQWFYSRDYFYRQLRAFVDAGFANRVMFGSDASDWPGVIDPAIDIIEVAPFLSEEQKRDILYRNAARFLRLSEEEIARHHGQ